MTVGRTVGVLEGQLVMENDAKKKTSQLNNQLVRDRKREAMADDIYNGLV